METISSHQAHLWDQNVRLQHPFAGLAMIVVPQMYFFMDVNTFFIGIAFSRLRMNYLFMERFCVLIVGLQPDAGIVRGDWVETWQPPEFWTAGIADIIFEDQFCSADQGKNKCSSFHASLEELGKVDAYCFAFTLHPVERYKLRKLLCRFWALFKFFMAGWRGMYWWFFDH